MPSSSPSRYGVEERGMVALVLVGVNLREGGDGAIEHLGGTEVARDCNRWPFATVLSNRLVWFPLAAADMRP
jgi:hypothetical protein